MPRLPDPGHLSSRLRARATQSTRRVIGRAANRVASSDRLMGLLYDVQNETNFGALAAHEEMLSDRVRVDAYHRAIRRNVRPGDVVVDVGTGTGLLAVMASKAGAAKVYAVEHSDVIEIAREIADHNDVDNIEFVRANSREFDPPEPVDLLVHEQMGDELFNENMVENLLDLRDRVLRPSGRILPARFRLFVEPVSFSDAMRVRRFWNIDLPDDIDLSPLEHSPNAALLGSERSEQFWARPGSVVSTIGTPSPLIEFDLATLESPDALPTAVAAERVATTDAIVDGLCVWFEADFDDAVSLSTSPLAPLTSWGNRVFRLDREVEVGEAVRYLLTTESLVDPATWSVQVA